MIEDEKIGIHTPRYGNSGYKRRDSDFYSTPSWVTEILIPYLPEGNIWEPACGEGDIVSVLEKYGKNCLSTDIREISNYKYVNGIFSVNFLERIMGDKLYPNIVTNPPYSLAKEFVEHAINLTEPENGFCALLLNNNWDTAKGNSLLTKLPCFDKKIVITKRIRWIVGSTGSPRENHAWYFWNWKTIDTLPTIHYS